MFGSGMYSYSRSIWQFFPVEVFDLLVRIELAEYKDVSPLGRTLYDTVDWNLTQAEIQAEAKVSLQL